MYCGMNNTIELIIGILIHPMTFAITYAITKKLRYCRRKRKFIISIFPGIFVAHSFSIKSTTISLKTSPLYKRKLKKIHHLAIILITLIIIILVQ